MKSRFRPSTLTVVAILLFISAFILFVFAFGAERRPSDAESKSFDVCDPHRPFCGRLLIVFDAAGERTTGTQKRNPDNTYTDDPEELETFSNFMQFRRQSPEGLISQAVVITSDPQLREKLRRLPKSEREISGFLGTESASSDTFQHFLENDTQSSLLNKALQNFELNSHCAALKELYGKSVLHFIKTEILLVGENSADERVNTLTIHDGGLVNGESALELWPTKQDVGSFEDWKKLPSREALNRDLARRITEKLDGSLIQTLPSTCYGSDIGSYFHQRDTCSCFLSVTNSSQRDFGGTKTYSAWSYLMADDGNAVRACKGNWAGATNLADMVSGIFRKFDHNPNITGPLFILSPYRNPLMGFSYGSIDARVDKILSDINPSSDQANSSRKYEKAVFISDLQGEKLQNGDAKTAAVTQPFSLSNGNARERFLSSLEQRSAEYKSILSRTIKREAKSPRLNNYAVGFNSFFDCLDKFNPKPEVCRVLRADFITPAYEDITSNGENASPESREITNVVTAFYKTMKDEDMPNLIKKYEGDHDISALFTSLQKIWSSYFDFRKTLADVAHGRAARKNPESPQIPMRFQLAFKQMNDFFKASFLTIQNELFPELQKEVLKVRLAKLDKAIELLKSGAIPSADEDMQELNNELGCMTSFPVGPAFDISYAKKSTEAY